MGIYDNDGDATSYPGPKMEEQEQKTVLSPSAQLSEDDLIEKMENVVLKSDENHGGGLECGGVLPLRPHAGNCPHYVRTGACKFGVGCKFNHPLKKTQQVVISKEFDSENSGTIECKYFSTAGGCRNGKSCKYKHLGEESENTAPMLNFLGLPMRVGEKECEYYMRNGTCAYGSRCMYHHPDHASMARNEYSNSMDEKLWKRPARPSENGNGGYILSRGTLQPYQAPWSSNKLSENIGGYSENRSSPQLMDKQSKWNGYEASNYSHQNRNSYSTPFTNSSVRKPDFRMQVEEYPERPGRPECDYFMKTGNCKFKSTCRFHHPKNRTPNPDDFLLSDKGLPLRPGRSICRYFERYGNCKFGSECLFDHPVDCGLSTFPDHPTSRTTVAKGNYGWDD